MSTIIKSYTVIIMCLLIFFLSINVISGHLDVQNANDYHAAVIDEIENSNHAISVINKIKNEAEENGYEIDITSYYGANSSIISKVTLKYKYRFDLLNVENEHEIVGYAR